MGDCGMTETPHIYCAISSVAQALFRLSVLEQSWEDRGGRLRCFNDIDEALPPLLIRHRLCMLPRVLERAMDGYREANGEMVFSVWVHVAFDFVALADGSKHTVETFGEALGPDDQGTSRAMAEAFRHAVMLSFGIPEFVGERSDEAMQPRLETCSQQPAEGWSIWVNEFVTEVSTCLTHEALDLVQAIHLDRLRLLSRIRPELYAYLGDAIGERRASFTMRRRMPA
jgi:hypothetical protein